MLSWRCFMFDCLRRSRGRFKTVVLSSSVPIILYLVPVIPFSESGATSLQCELCCWRVYDCNIFSILCVILPPSQNRQLNIPEAIIHWMNEIFWVFHLLWIGDVATWREVSGTWEARKVCAGADSNHGNGQKLAPKLLRKRGWENIGQYSQSYRKISEKSTVHAQCDVNFFFEIITVKGVQVKCEVSSSVAYNCWSFLSQACDFCGFQLSRKWILS